MWAITTLGIGKPVTARAILPDWGLVEGESFTVDFWTPGMVLAEDGVSLRDPLPEDETPAPPRTKFSSRDFLKRFTKQEQLAVVTATMSNAQVKLLWDNLLAADYIDLADPEVEEGIDYLIAQELIGADRKAEVLA